PDQGPTSADVAEPGQELRFERQGGEVLDRRLAHEEHTRLVTADQAAGSRGLEGRGAVPDAHDDGLLGVGPDAPARLERDEPGVADELVLEMSKSFIEGGRPPGDE